MDDTLEVHVERELGMFGWVIVLKCLIVNGNFLELGVE